MRHIQALCFAMAMICWLVACGGEPVQQGYSLTGTLWQDSLSPKEVLLYTGGRGEVEQIAVPLDKGSFTYQGEASNVTELVLAYGGHTLHLYAMPDADIVLQMDSAGNVSWSGKDSINGWLAEHEQALQSMSGVLCKRYVDSVCHQPANGIRATLLLHEQMKRLNDSLFVRRCLGSLSEEAKPLWLMNKLNDQFDRLSLKKSRNNRSPRVTVKLSNDSLYGFLDARQESMLVFFWADYSPASIDSLQLLKEIVRDYGENHKVDLMTICVHAADSASWLATIDSIPGKHTWLKGGFAHPLLALSGITSVPANLQMDRFSNVQGVDRWNKTLRTWLENTPTKNRSANPVKTDKSGTNKPKSRQLKSSKLK